MSEDIKALVTSIQRDYGVKLDAHVTELVNRIVMEHEERIRSLDEMKNNIDLKDKINNEK